MAYATNEDPYINPKTGILRNKIGAKTQAQLNTAESEITYIIITTLTKGSRPQKLVFRTQLLCDIHEEIFRDIYKWAGKIRTHDISKDWAYFCHAEYIQQSLDTISEELESDIQLSQEDKSAFIERMTYYYSELNAIHPFREGNGRAIRTFLRLLALKYGYDIEWAKMDASDNISASETALKGDTSSMHDMLSKLITKLS